MSKYMEYPVLLFMSIMISHFCGFHIVLLYMLAILIYSKFFDKDRN